MSSWVIEIRDPAWSASLYCQRVFQTPEAAACYAQSLIDIPEIWVHQEGPALVRLLETCDPDHLQVRITCQ